MATLPSKVPTPDTTPASSSLLYIVDSPYGTPADNATTVGDAVTKGHGLSDTGAVTIKSGVMAPPTGTPTGAKFLRDDGSWQPIGGGGDALTTSPLSQFAATTSAQLRGVLSDETGTGAAVFATSPALTTPDLGTPTALVATNATGTASGLTAGNATLAATATVANGLKSATTTVAVSSATAPTSGQVLTATGTTAATWQTPAGGGGQTTFTKIVAPSGGDYTTLSAAITASTDGWIIRVMPGTYTEAGAVSTSIGLTIEGAGTASTVLNFSSHVLELDGTNVTMRNIQVNFTTGGLQINGNDALVDGISWNKTAGTADGFYLLGDRSALVNSQIVSTNTTSGTPLVFVATGNHGGRICNNFFSSGAIVNSDATFKFAGIGTLVTGNRFEVNAGNVNVFIGIQNGNTVFNNNSIEDLFGSNTASCVKVTQSGNVLDGNNIVAVDAGTGIEIAAGFGANYNVVSGNFVHAKQGIKISGTDTNKNTVTGNRLRGYGTANSSKGIDVTYDNNIISSNMVDNYQTGIIINSGTKNSVVGNISLNNGTNFTDSGTTTTAGNNITA